MRDESDFAASVLLDDLGIEQTREKLAGQFARRSLEPISEMGGDGNEVEHEAVTGKGRYATGGKKLN